MRRFRLGETTIPFVQNSSPSEVGKRKAGIWDASGLSTTLSDTLHQFPRLSSNLLTPLDGCFRRLCRFLTLLEPFLNHLLAKVGEDFDGLILRTDTGSSV